MDFLAQYRMTEALYIGGIVIAAVALSHLIPYLVRSWCRKNQKGIVFAVVSIVIASAAICYLVDPFIPPSEQSVHRGGYHDGNLRICKKAPVCTNCDTDTGCAVCGSREACLKAVDEYGDECFDGLYGQWGKISRARTFLAFWMHA